MRSQDVRALPGTKTVETHVRNICGKLGVRRRTDVVRELERSRPVASEL